ncbi:MAG TPA: hypothetical protein VM163_01380 [bacterium]|nr:hypothetical protein [bacterium]
MTRLIIFASILLLCMSTAAFGQVAVFADIGLNKDIFYPPDQFEIWVRGANPGLETEVDVYLSIGTPDGRELFAPDFNEMAHPWMPNVVLPQGFSMDWTLIYAYALPSIAFPLATPGQYMASLRLYAAGTDEPITLGSSEAFTIAPCDRKSWVNDNYILSLGLTEEGIWAGLKDGLELIAYDGLVRRLFRGEDGVRSAGSYLFWGFDRALGVGGTSIGISLKHPYGWRTLLNSPGTPWYTYGVRAAVTDAEGTIWTCHGCLYSNDQDGSLLRCYPSGFVEDYSSIVGLTRHLCLTGDGRACAVGTDGLNVHNGESFEFHEIVELQESSSILCTDAHGDLQGNIWMVIWGGQDRCKLCRYDLDAREMTVYGLGTPGLGNNPVEAITSDPMGNVWLSVRGSGVAMFDGTGFIAFPADIWADSIAVGFDNTIFCGTRESGIQVLKDGMWLDYQNPNPEVSYADYQFILGLVDGGAIACADNGKSSLGYELLEGEVWQRVGDDGSLPIKVTGMFEGKMGLWAWSSSPRPGAAYRQTESGWLDTTEGCSLGQFGSNIKCVMEDDDGNPYLLMSQGRERGLLSFRGGTWATVDVPPPTGLFGYNGLMIDHSGRIFLCDTDSGIEVRDAQGSWTRIDTSNLLPAEPENFSLSELGLLYVHGSVEDTGRHYLTIVNVQDFTATSYWLEDIGFPTYKIVGVTFDLEDRAWILTQTANLAARTIIYNPGTETFAEIPWEAGLIPDWAFRNLALQYSLMLDRSMSRYGVLWCGHNGPKRVNLAPRTQMLLDKDAYSSGEAMRVEACFANQAGSVPIDWFAAIEDEQGNLFYWPSYTQEKTPAFAGLLVPTDTAFILPLDAITIPDGIAPGHYKWKTGFTRAGDSTWLGLGFTASAEFDIVAGRKAVPQDCPYR